MAFERARWRAWCFGSVIELDVAKKNGHSAERYYVPKRQPHVWTEEEYQKALAGLTEISS